MRGPGILVAVVPFVAAACSFGESGTNIVSRTIEADEIRLLPTSSGFVAVRDVILLDGSLWVLDGAPPFGARVALGDGEARHFGTEGEGPGEFLDPRAIQPTLSPDTSGVLVWDLGAGRVSEFDGSGTFLESARLSDRGRIRARSNIRDVSYADPFRVRNNRLTFMVGQFPRRIDRTGDLARGSLNRADRLLEPGPELALFSDHVAEGALSFREWSPMPFWDACDGVVVLWSPGSEEILWLDSSGTIGARVPVELPSAPVSLKDIERYLRWMGRLELGPGYEDSGIDFASLALEYRSQFADQRPVATDLRCESRGVAWMRMFDTSADPLGRGTDWLKVSIDAVIERFNFPAEFNPVVFTGQAIYGTLEVSEGHQSLARWGEDPAG